jgi:hypothetical protein
MHPSFLPESVVELPNPTFNQSSIEDARARRLLADLCWAFSSIDKHGERKKQVGALSYAK